MSVNDLFHKISSKVATKVGSPGAFLLALSIVAVWALTGPLFGFSDTWQLVINTGTTVVTFLMVFVIQNTQNRDAKAMHLKMDELIRTVKGARNELVDVEDFSDAEIKALAEDFKKLHPEHTSNVTKALHQRVNAEHQRRRLPHLRNEQ